MSLGSVMGIATSTQFLPLSLQVVLPCKDSMLFMTKACIKQVMDTQASLLNVEYT